MVIQVSASFVWRKTWAINNVVPHAALFLSVVAQQALNVSSRLVKWGQHSNHALYKLNAQVPQTETTGVVANLLFYIVLYIYSYVVFCIIIPYIMTLTKSTLWVLFYLPRIKQGGG